MWFVCDEKGCICSFNSPKKAAEHEEQTGHRVVFDGYDWEEQL